MAMRETGRIASRARPVYRLHFPICTAPEGSKERGVRNIKPRCNEGSIRWRNPNGGLRVQLHAGYTSDFRACFAVDATNIAVKVSQEFVINSDNQISSHRSSYLHAVAITTNRTKEICIPSSSSYPSVLLYLETERLQHQSGVQKVTFHYVMEPIRSNRLLYNPMEEECRPCDPRELVRAYCSSDFVVTGKMTAVTHLDDLDRTKMDVEVTRVIRQKGQLFTYFREDQSLRGSMVAPRHCGVEYGVGDFLFTGYLRLGHMAISCSPYLSEWRQVLTAALADGTMECEVD
ncbi:Meteorin-like protein [Mizuhopecten yessoensis]|uniref:Meteorin-like protein n=1 Tax=Mizuhopecten yessoensis TaxID=6573 RepID=A0A210Q0Z2_MIZYE|nr:Meteorin-like protein [Mizuhopecten yessoensis]